MLRCSCYLRDSTAEFLQCIGDVKKHCAKGYEEMLKFLTKISDRLNASRDIMVDKEYLGQVLDHEAIKYDFLYEDGDQSESDDSSNGS